MPIPSLAVDEISLMIMDCRKKIDNYKDGESIEDFPELDEFNELDEEEEN